MKGVLYITVGRWPLQTALFNWGHVVGYLNSEEGDGNETADS